MEKHTPPPLLQVMWFVAEAMTDVGVPDAVVTSPSGMAFLERVGKPVYETMRTLCLNRARQRTSLELQMQVCLGRVLCACVLPCVVAQSGCHVRLKLAPWAVHVRVAHSGQCFVLRRTVCNPALCVYVTSKRGAVALLLEIQNNEER